MGAAPVTPDVKPAQPTHAERKTSEGKARSLERWRISRKNAPDQNDKLPLTPTIYREMRAARKALEGEGVAGASYRQVYERALKQIAGRSPDTQNQAVQDADIQPNTLTPKQHTRGEVSPKITQLAKEDKIIINGVHIDLALQPGGGPIDSKAIQDGIMRELNKVLDKGDDKGDTVAAATEFVRVATEAGISSEELRDAFGKRLKETEMKAVFPENTADSTENGDAVKRTDSKGATETTGPGSSTEATEADGGEEELSKEQLRKKSLMENLQERFGKDKKGNNKFDLLPEEQRKLLEDAIADVANNFTDKQWESYEGFLSQRATGRISKRRAAEMVRLLSVIPGKIIKLNQGHESDERVNALIRTNQAEVLLADRKGLGKLAKEFAGGKTLGGILRLLLALLGGVTYETIKANTLEELMG